MAQFRPVALTYIKGMGAVMIDVADKRGELLKYRRNSFLEGLVLLARQPDGGNNLHLAARNIEEIPPTSSLKSSAPVRTRMDERSSCQTEAN